MFLLRLCGLAFRVIVRDVLSIEMIIEAHRERVRVTPSYSDAGEKLKLAPAFHGGDDKRCFCSAESIKPGQKIMMNVYFWMPWNSVLFNFHTNFLLVSFLTQPPDLRTLHISPFAISVRSAKCAAYADTKTAFRKLCLIS